MSATTEAAQRPGSTICSTRALDRARSSATAGSMRPAQIEMLEPATGEVLGDRRRRRRGDDRPRGGVGRGGAARHGRRRRSPSASRSCGARPSCSSATATRSRGWMIRESGSIPRQGRPSRCTASIGQLDMAAALISQPLGDRAAVADARPDEHRAPRPGRRRRRDHAVELPGRARDALDRAGARARQRGRAQVGPEHAGHRRRGDRAPVRGGRAAGGRAARRSRAAPRSARRSPRTRTSA